MSGETPENKREKELAQRKELRRAKQLPDSYDSYYNDVSRHPPLTPAKERNLLVKYHHTKCSYARQRLVESNLRFVVKMAKRFSRNNNAVLMDLVSAGNMGLLRALELYDPGRNVRFLTYATSWILLFIRNELRNTELVAMPSWRKKAIRQINRVRERIASAEGREARPEEIAHEAGISSNRIDSLTGNGKFAYESEDICNYNPGAIAIGADRDESLPDEQLILKQQRDLVEQLLQSLSARERPIVCNYFGLVIKPGGRDGSVGVTLVETEPWSMKKIGSFLNVSSERIRQIKLLSIKKLRHRLKTAGINAVEDV